MNCSVDIIIVNWNSGHHLRNCLDSIAMAQADNFDLKQVVIVDNASSDESLKDIGNLNLPLRFIYNHVNLGFAAACNQGASGSFADYLLFLNPDTRFFKNSLSIPLAFMQQAENANVGITGVQLVDENSRIARSCFHFPTVGIFVVRALGLNRLPGLGHLSHAMVEWKHTNTRQVDQIMGAFFLVRRSVFVSLGGFDVRYFVFFEEVDLSLRARQAGWSSVFLAEAQAFHASAGGSSQVKAKRLFYSLRSRLLYGFKHFSPWSAWVLLAVTLVLEPVSRSVFSLLRGDISDVRNTWESYGMLYRDLTSILSAVY
jgi:GT2 family glycosyltransferase